MKEKTVILNKERNVVLTCFLVGQNKPAVLICPGGGYNECSVSEGKPVAEKFNSLGFNAFVLCYSVGKNYKWPYPLEDFENAMAYIKANGKQFSVDTEHIVAAGFSAGGHLVSYAASKAENKPYAAIILYGAAKAQTINYTAPDAPDAVEAVNLYTCPCFLAASRNDWIVPVNNTLMAMKSDYKKAFSPNLPSLVAPESMLASIRTALGEENLSLANALKSVYISLAKSYDKAIKDIEKICRKQIENIIIVGGGSKDKYLNRLTSEITGKKVFTGLSEATALGNIAVQIMYDKKISLTEARQVIKQSFDIKECK